MKNNTQYSKMDKLNQYLEKFITGVIQEWHKAGNGEILTFPEFKELVLENKSSFKIGSEGEDFIASLIRSKHYWVIPSPGSKSPSDMWCLSKGNLFGSYHLALIQVKNTEEFEKPEILNDEKIKTFRHFSSFVLSCWNKSELTKTYPHYLNIVISTGYAGVVSQNSYRKLFNPRYYNFWYANKLENDLWKIKDYIEKFHYLR